MVSLPEEIGAKKHKKSFQVQSSYVELSAMLTTIRRVFAKEWKF